MKASFVGLHHGLGRYWAPLISVKTDRAGFWDPTCNVVCSVCQGNLLCSCIQLLELQLNQRNTSIFVQD